MTVLKAVKSVPCRIERLLRANFSARPNRSPVDVLLGNGSTAFVRHGIVMKCDEYTQESFLGDLIQIYLREKLVVEIRCQNEAAYSLKIWCPDPIGGRPGAPQWNAIWNKLINAISTVVSGHEKSIRVDRVFTMVAEGEGYRGSEQVIATFPDGTKGEVFDGMLLYTKGHQLF